MMLLMQTYMFKMTQLQRIGSAFDSSPISCEFCMHFASFVILIKFAGD
jgi:hypothetical protein